MILKYLYRFFGFISFFIIVLFTFYLTKKIDLIFAYFIAINLVTLIMYFYDKKISQRRGVRVPERILHGLSFFGGSICGLIAQKVFRHKTKKGSFLFVYWLIVILQLGLIFYQFLK